MRVVLAGGGTAGHVNPLLATAGELQRRLGPEAQLLVLGTAEGLEAQLVPAAGLELLTVPKVPFPRAVGGQALRFPARFRAALRQTRELVQSFSPQVVVGFGGYVSPPAYLAARRLDIPLVIHEANARAGLANQLGARYAQSVATTFPGSKLAKAQVTGLPMRPELAQLDRLAQREASRSALGLDPTKPCLLVAGGSLGAQHLNQAMADLAGSLLAGGTQVLHLTGKGKSEVLTEALSQLAEAQHYHTIEYLDAMELAWSAADLAVSRAGAGSVCELACAALPSVLVPLAVGNGEQRHNAAELVAAGGAQIVADAAFPAWAAEHLLDLLKDPAKLQTMAQGAAQVARRDGAGRLVDLIEQAASSPGRSKAKTPAPQTPLKASAAASNNVTTKPKCHFIGVGGVGMAAVAELAVAAGWQVSGCDWSGSARLDHLAALGVKTHLGHDPAHLSSVDQVVVSSAIRQDNPELVAARQAGIDVQHRAQALAQLAEGQRLLAVSGTHGKTTTAAMAAAGLQAAGLDPSFAIGAEVLGAGSGAQVGQGGIMVIEADESDESFLFFRPEVAVITNVEADHLDHYGSAEAVMASFQTFVSQADWSVIGLDDPGGRQLAAWAADQGLKVVGFGVDAAAQVVISPSSSGSMKMAGTVGAAELDLTIKLPQPGWHLRQDAAAATIGAVLMGADPALVAKGLETYAGTGRRFELKAEIGSVRVVDDYAHHPTEVQATLAAARQVSTGQVLVVFQPHLYSRTKAFATQFAEALDQADLVWVLDVYAAREAPDWEVSSSLIVAKMDQSKAVHEPNRDQVAAAVAAAAQPGDLIITMGAGDVDELAGPIAEALGAK